MEESESIGSQCRTGSSTRWMGQKPVLCAQIFFLQHFSMMQFVSGNDVGQCSDGDGIVVGGSATGANLGIDMPEQVHGCSAHVNKFFDQIVQRAIAKVTAADEVVLLKSRKRRLVAAGNTQGPIGHNAF